MTVGQCRKYISEGRVLRIAACGLTKRRTCHTICWLWLRVFGPEGSSDEVSVASHPVYRRRVRVFARANEDCIRCACSGGSYVLVHKFDPKRNAAADIQEAIGEAQRT